jgi:hypothetical protein
MFDFLITVTICTYMLISPSVTCQLCYFLSVREKCYNCVSVCVHLLISSVSSHSVTVNEGLEMSALFLHIP